MRTLRTIIRMARTCACVVWITHSIAFAGEQKVLISGYVRKLTTITISDGDTIERILEKAGGPVVLKDGRKVPLRYATIYKNKQGPDDRSRVVVKRRDWHRKIVEFAPLDTIVVVDFVDPEAYLWEEDEAKATDQAKQPPTPAPKGSEKPTPPSAPSPSGTHKPEKSQPPVEKPTHPVGGNSGEPAKPKQP